MLVWRVPAPVAFLVYALALVAPPDHAKRHGGSTPQEQGSFATMLLNPTVWLPGLAFGCFGFSMLGFNTWVSSHLTATLRTDPANASLYASPIFLAAIPGKLVARWVPNRTRNRYTLLDGAFLLTGIILAASFQPRSVRAVAPNKMPAGFLSTLISPSLFTLAPETMRNPGRVGLGLALTIVGANSGALAGPPILRSVLRGATGRRRACSSWHRWAVATQLRCRSGGSWTRRDWPFHRHG